MRFERISIDKGLSQNIVECILQDSRGFMWFGTEDGLNRFNGYNFKIYYEDANNANSLGHDNILSIIEDRYGVFWIGTFHG